MSLSGCSCGICMECDRKKREADLFNLSGLRDPWVPPASATPYEGSDQERGDRVYKAYRVYKTAGFSRVQRGVQEDVDMNMRLSEFPGMSAKERYETIKNDSDLLDEEKRELLGK